MERIAAFATSSTCVTWTGASVASFSCSKWKRSFCHLRTVEEGEDAHDDGLIYLIPEGTTKIKKYEDDDEDAGALLGSCHARIPACRKFASSWMATAYGLCMLFWSRWNPQAGFSNNIS